jgi:hypothetical protein
VIYALGMLLDFRKAYRNTLACGSSIFTLSESLATSLVHGSRNPAWKTIRYSFINEAELFTVSHKICIALKAQFSLLNDGF